MARYPRAIWKPLRENSTQPRIRPRAIILHSAVSDAESLFDFFQNSSELESHFYVRRSGVVEQYLDTTVQADANYKANSFAISIETWDGRTPDIRGWNPNQITGLVGLCDWICDTHAIPRTSIATWDGTGIGYHTQFGAPGPWTPVAKTCPGIARIGQVPALIHQIAQKGTAVSEPTINPWSYKNDDALADGVPDMVGKDAYALLMRTCNDARVIRKALGGSQGLSAIEARLERIENLLRTLVP